MGVGRLGGFGWQGVLFGPDLWQKMVARLRTSCADSFSNRISSVLLRNGVARIVDAGQKGLDSTRLHVKVGKRGPNHCVLTFAIDSTGRGENPFGAYQETDAKTERQNKTRAKHQSPRARSESVRSKRHNRGIVFEPYGLAGCMYCMPEPQSRRASEFSV